MADMWDGNGPTYINREDAGSWKTRHGHTEKYVIDQSSSPYKKCNTIWAKVKEKCTMIQGE